MDEEYIEEENTGLFSRIKAVFSGNKDEDEEVEAPAYERRLFDGRIEKFLDQNLDSYITEYGIVTQLDLQGYEERYNGLTGRVSTMKEFMMDSDAAISRMEKELKDVKSKGKKTKK